jgi:hypothetical protein
MVCTKETYTLTAPWTTTQFMDLLGSAFEDAGLMTAWHNVFTNGSIRHAILEVTYDASATFGKCYYWFNTDGSTLRLNLATGWSQANNQPVGTQWLDFSQPIANMNAMSGYTVIDNMSINTTFNLTRYTSGLNNTHSHFLLQSSATVFRTFSIGHPSHNVAPWIDMGKNLFHAFLIPVPSVPQGFGFGNSIGFSSVGAIRRSYGVGVVLRGDINNRAANIFRTVASYAGYGKASNNVLSNANANEISSWSALIPRFALTLPVASAQPDANPAYSSDHNPVCTGMPYSFEQPGSALPADIGIVQHFANNNLKPLDRFIVTAGVEEWEIIHVINNSTANSGLTLALAARVV